MDLILQAQELLPHHLDNLPSFQQLLADYIKSPLTHGPIGYSGVHITDAGPVHRDGDILVGFYALTPVTTRCRVGDITWSFSLQRRVLPWLQGNHALSHYLCSISRVSDYTPIR
jgi:hypothetical protein